ncbi:MAG: IgGFc-binding protein, partial [Paludibacteraceae bacterium]|nr:IgGFc-binding protein [Paludibacteraceae bacterium]
MKNKHIFMSLFLTLMVLPPLAMKAQDNQTTEGTDFWFTLMRADADNPEELSLTISAKNACTVTIENPTTGYRETVNMTAGGLERKILYDGTIDHKADCYVGTADDEVNNVFKAIHVTSTDNISLFAGNWREKSFDVANLLPTASLRDEYVICAYTPSDHENKEQGSHFAIVATEDNTIVDFVVTAATKGMPSNPGGGFIGGGSSNDVYNGKGVGDTLTTPVLKAGQVWYVWTGNNDGDDADLTGSYIKARDGKRIAVFNGNPHTNVPHKVRDRDHLYSQAMPTVYWGTKFPITGSKTTKGSNYTTFYDRQKDKVRVLAYYDGTEVYINGTLAHTFNFAANPHHYFEFELGDGTMTDPQHSSMYTVPGTSCFVETSCPTAVHMFMVSNRYDFPSSPYCNGDPAMIWMNPIEQVIDEITFGTYRDYSHFTNVVTETANVNSMTLDGNIIAGEFQALAGNSNYSFARINIPSGTHTLKGSAGFIAHVYGTGEKESYGYSAGGATKPLEQYVSINGQIFTPDTKNVLC